jgi:hypothetical protein
MSVEPLTVVIGHTGAVGATVVRMLAHRNDIRIVGALAHGEGKVGRDLGDIVGVGHLGVTATADVDSLIALRADCLMWHGAVWHPDVIGRFLAAGTNVYSGYGAWFPLGNSDDRTIADACAAGGSTYVAGGNIPGLISDVLPLFLTGFVGNLKRIRARQSNFIAGYPSALQLRRGLGIGIPPGAQSSDTAAVDTQMSWAIKQSAAMVATGLGIEMTDFRLMVKEYALAPEDTVLRPSGLFVKKGTSAGVRWTWAALHGDHPFFEVTNEQVVLLGLGKGWRESIEEPHWTVDVHGDPDLHCAVSLPVAGEGQTAPSTILNAARAINFLPVVVAAGPGIKTVLDLPAPRAETNAVRAGSVT